MVRLNCLKEFERVSMVVCGGVGTNLSPLESIDLSGLGMSWSVRLTIKLLSV